MHLNALTVCRPVAAAPQTTLRFDHVPVPTPDTVNIPPPDTRIPPIDLPTPIPPEVQEPVLPGEHSPVTDPARPGSSDYFY